MARVINEGLRQFHRPPRAPGERFSYQWKFLRPYGSLVMAADVETYDLPDDFAGIDGYLYYTRDAVAFHAIQIVNHSHLLQRRQQYWLTTARNEPEIAAIAPKPSDGSSQQIYELHVWPAPDQAYTVNYRYFARQPPLVVDTQVPLGGSDHASTIRASCLAAAEQSLDDARGEKWSLFMERLAASIDFDRRVGSPRHLGYNAERSVHDFDDGSVVRSIGGLVTLEAFPADGSEAIPAGSLVTQDGQIITTQDGQAVVVE